MTESVEEMKDAVLAMKTEYESVVEERGLTPFFFLP